MKSFTHNALFLGLAMTAPFTEALVARAVTSAKATSSLNTNVMVSSTSVRTITVAPTTTLANPTALPSTFSAPIQGHGKLTLDNLPALPDVLDKTFSGVLGTVYSLMSGACNQDHKCTIYVSGTIQSLLVDGGSYTGNSTVSAWCDGGRCYASADPTVTATSPFTITCDDNSACSAVISGAATAIFTNGKQIEIWGWVNPSGYCQNGICTASMKAFGDPMY